METQTTMISTRYVVYTLHTFISIPRYQEVIVEYYPSMHVHHLLPYLLHSRARRISYLEAGIG